MYLSIIIPVYNTASYVTDCINSLLFQKNVLPGIDYEIICVNDGSSDNSLEVLSSFSSQIGGVFNCKSTK